MVDFTNSAPVVDNGLSQQDSQDRVAALPTTTFDAKLAKLRGELATAVAQKSVELEQAKEIAKQPITTNSFRAAYKGAAGATDYQTFQNSGISPELGEERLRTIYNEVNQAKANGIAKQGSNALFSDAELNESGTKSVANIALTAVGRVGDIAGNLFNTGVEIGQTLRKAGISDDELATLKTVKQKEDVYQDSVDALRHETDEGKKTILRERVLKNAPENYTDKEKALFMPTQVQVGQIGEGFGVQEVPSVVERMRKVNIANNMEKNIDEYSGLITNLVNNSSVQTMMESAIADYRRAAPQLGNGVGNTAEAIVDLAVEAGKTIIDNPEALMQLVVQSAPDVITAGRAMPAALAGNFSEKQSEARDLYKQTHDGQEATGADLAKLNAGAVAATLLDTFGDKFVHMGGGDLVKLANSVGLRTGNKVVDTTARVATKLTQGTVTGAAGEFIAEGGGNALIQLAGTQDTSKVDLAQSYAEGVLGAGAGGAMTTVTAGLNQAVAINEDINQKLETRAAAVEAGSIKEMVSNPASMDISGATAVMKKIVGSTEHTPEQKAEAVTDLETAFQHRPFIEMYIVRQEELQKDEFSEKRAASIEKAEKILTEMDKAAETLKVTKESLRGTSVEAAYKALTQEDGNPTNAPDTEIEASRQAAADVIINDVGSKYSTIDSSMAQEILDKRADILTPEQVSNLRTYVSTTKAIEALDSKLDEAQVRSDIINGGNGNIGARTYVNAIISSIKLKDNGGAIKLAEDLNNFAQRHTMKAAAMGAIIESFDSGHPMAPEDQIALMSPFNSAVKGSTFKPFVRAVPKYARMIQAEADMLNTVATEMNNRVSTLAPKPQAASTQVSSAQSTSATEVSSAGNVSPGSDTLQPANNTAPEKATLAEPEAAQANMREEIAETRGDEVVAAATNETPSGDAITEQPVAGTENTEATPAGSTSPDREVQAQPKNNPPVEGPDTRSNAERTMRGLDVPAGSVQETWTQAQPDPEHLIRDLLGDEQNLIARFVKIKQSKTEGNPLINDPQFIQTLRTKGVSYQALKPYLPESMKTLLPGQINLLKNFLVFNQAFSGSIDEAVGQMDIKFAHKDPIQYFRDTSGKLKQSVVDAMSVSAFNWLIVNANDSLVKDDSDYEVLTGVKHPKGKPYSNYTHSTYGQIGLPFEDTAVSLGNEIINTLGLALNTADAPHTLMSRIASSLGARTLQTLGQITVGNDPLIKFINISAEERNKAHNIESDGEPTIRYDNPLRTVQVSYTVNNFGVKEPLEYIKSHILEIAKESNGIMSTLFNAITSERVPTFTPVSAAQSSPGMKRTDRKISKQAQDSIDKFNQTKTYIKPAMAKVFNSFMPEEMAEMFGFRTELDKKVHADVLKSEESKNNLIKRNVDKVYDFFRIYRAQTNSDNFDTPFYLNMETTRVNRAQVTQSIMNMQSDKTARHMAYQEDWKTEIEFTDKPAVDMFMLAVGQALGVSLDKNKNTESLAKTQEILNKPIIVDGIIAATALLNDQATPDQLADLKAAVMYQGGSAAVLDGLMAYAQFKDAFDKGAPSFTSELGVEYDGVTNGPMLTLSQFAFATNEWAKDLAAGGIYINSTLENVVDAKRSGIADRYERVTQVMSHIFNNSDRIPAYNREDSPHFKLTGEFKNALNTLFGVLSETDDNGNMKVTKLGRDLAKAVVTPKTYQSGDSKTKQKLGETALENIRDLFTELGNAMNDPEITSDERMSLKSKADALYNALTVLADKSFINVPVVNGKKDYLKAQIKTGNVYSYESVEGLPINMTFQDMISATYGAMFTNAVNLINKPMEEMTGQSVLVTNIAVMLYEQARTNLINEALLDKKNTGEPLSEELTVAELKDIDDQLQDMFPEVMTALSGQQGTGVSLVESSGRGSATPYKMQLNLSPKTQPAYSISGERLSVPKATYFSVNATEIQNPGVTGVVNNVLATDGAIAAKGIAGTTDSLSLFDAYMSGALHASENGKVWNRAMYSTMLNHSIPVNIANMVNNVYRGFASRFDTSTITPEILEKYFLNKEFTAIPSLEEIQAKLDMYTEQANKMQEAKRAALTNNTATINQYYSEGAAVTYVNGAEVVRDENLDTELTAAIKTAADAIRNSRNGDDVSVDQSEASIAEPTNNITASADNDLRVSPELSTLLSTGPVNLSQAMRELGKYSKSPTANAVSAIAQNILKNSDSDTVVVAYDARKTYTGNLEWLNTNQDIIQYANKSRGMYFPKSVTGNTNTIVLMADSMPYPGVTTETLFHEAIHALFDKEVFNSANSPIGAELQNLVKTVRSKIQEVVNNDPAAKAFVDSFGGINRLPALTNMREFVAWGLSSASFQNILKQINYVSKNDLDNKLNITPRSVLAKFRDLIQKLVFNRAINASTNEAVDNALNALITVSLATQSAIGNTDVSSVSRQQGPASQLHNITRLNSKQLFNTLRNIGGVQASGSHEVFLRNMLSTVVNAVLNPIGVNLITAAASETTSQLSAHDKLEIFVADNQGIQMTNLPPQYGFNKSAQEVYVHGLYMAILEEGLKVSTAHTNAADNYFNLAKAHLTYKNFMMNPNSVDPVEIKMAQDRYDSVFNVTASKITVLTDPSSGLSTTQEKSDYLRNFLALAATNESFRNALDSIPIQSQVAPATLFERIIALISKIIDTVSDRIVGINPKLSNTQNIDMLTKRLVGAELRAQSEAERVLNANVEYTSAAMGSALVAVKKSLYKMGKLPIFKNNPLQTVRVASTFARIIGSNKTQFFFQVADDIFSSLNKGKQTFVGEVVSEIKGTTKDNAKVHSLLRVANFTLDRGRKAVIETMGKTLAAQFKGELTKNERTAITKQLLRTDAVALLQHGYSLSDIANLIDDAAYREQEIQKFEDKIRNSVTTRLANFYLNQAEDLGFTMVNGYSSNVGSIPNAHGIVRLWGTNELVPGDAVLEFVEPLIDGLASLHAIRTMASKGTYTAAAVNLIRREYSRTDGDNGVDNNGITFLFAAHQKLKDKALAENFGGNPALVRKGYMPDINNPYIDIRTAPRSDAEQLKQMGYKEAYDLEKDPYDPNPGDVALFVGDGAGMATYMRGALSITGQKTKGNQVKDFGDVMVMHARKQPEIAKLFTGRVHPNSGRNQSYMQAVYNEQGQVSGYRYIMAETTKDELLSRNEDFSEVMAKLAGNVYDKSVTKPHNHSVIDSLKEQYDADIAAGKVNNYIRVSGQSTDPELKDLYNLLPYETKQYIKQTFGSESVPIRAEFLRVIFGYRKVTIADIWKDGGIDNNLFQTAVKSMFETLFGESGMQRASQFERVIQDLVRVAKANVVVRMGSTTLSNLLSNTYDLVVRDVPLRQAIADQVTGYKKGIEYVRQGSRIAELNLLLQADHNPTQRRAMENELAQLKHLQSINPVAELVEAGLLQTIVMDMNQDIDPFSYSSVLANKFDRQLNRLPGEAKDAAKFVFMTRDSASFEFMNKIVQFSDFAARYALYKQLTTRANNPMDKASAIQEVITQFINYDLPTHRALQYGNDMGLLWFTRYWLRVQKVIVQNFAEHPAKILLGMAMQNVVGVDVPNNADSSLIHTGVFHPVRGLDGIGSALMANPIVPEL